MLLKFSGASSPKWKKIRAEVAYTCPVVYGMDISSDLV
jgi:hypothetical protein